MAAPVARLRHKLLRVSKRAEVAEAGLDALREVLGPDPTCLVHFAEAHQALELEGPAHGSAFELRSPGGHSHGHVVIVAERTRVLAANGDILLITEDLAQAFDNVAAVTIAAEAARLRDAVTRRDQLVRQAGEALIRDAHEMVRVVAELEQRDALIKEDLQQALRFQKAMIAPLPAHHRLSMSAIYLAAETISGDFYDVARLSDERLRFLIADATGHGVAAGLATMFIKSEYEAQKRLHQTPGELLFAINEQLSSSYRNLELQFTALCMDLDLATGRLRYASAAHPGPVLLRASGTKTLPTGGPFVGVITGVSFPEHEIELGAGDMLVAFTDGLLDASAPDGTMFGESRIVEAIASVSGDGAEACPALVRALASFVGERHGLTDDVTIVAFSVRSE